MSDVQIVATLGIEWDEDGRLILEADRSPRPTSEPTGRISAVGRELPRLEAVGLDEVTLEQARSMRPLASNFYVVMFWSVWHRRGLSAEQVWDKWRAHVASNN